MLLREEIDYLREVGLGEPVSVDLEVLALSPDGGRWKLRHTISREGGEVAARVVVTGGWLDLARRRLAIAPEALLSVFRGAPRAEGSRNCRPCVARTVEEYRLAMNGTLTPLQRFFLAFVAFFYVLVNRRFAEEVKLVRDRERLALPPPEAPPEPPRAEEPRPQPPAPAPTPEPTPAPAPTPPTVPAAAAAPPAPAQPPHAEALQVLALLQRDGRLIDFLSENLEGFSDSEIGAAARTVHAGCRKALDAYLDLEPVYREAEGANVVVAPGFDPNAVRLTGNVVGEPPFQGSLRHHGWRATRAAFPPPTQSHDPRILAPAEVEL